MTGRAPAGVVKIANVADEQIAVDRVALRDGPKLSAVLEMLRIVRDVRRRRFDLVVDLHSLYETNLLGWLSGARHRLFADRENRSINRLSNFPVKPPPEDKTLHHAERYRLVVEALGAECVPGRFRLIPDDDDATKAGQLLERIGVHRRFKAGLFAGAGHHGRRWSLERFAELARRLAGRGDVDVLVLLGPEEADVRPHARDLFSDTAVVVDELPLGVFAALLSTLDAFVSTDTGPMHLAAVAGAPIVLITRADAPDIFLPLTERLHIVSAESVADASVDDVFAAVARALDTRK